MAASLGLLVTLSACTDSAARTPVVSVTNTTQRITGPVTVELGGESLEFGELRSGEKRRISYLPQRPSDVTVRWPGHSVTLPRRIAPGEAGGLGNDVNVLLVPDGAVLDPKKNAVNNQ